MSELGELYLAKREGSKARRAKHREHAPEVLQAAGLAFTSHNDGAHLVVDGRVDLWPGTGLWVVRKTGQRGRGVANLVRLFDVGGVR